MRNTCTVGDCGRDVEGHGLCKTHYARWKRTGIVPTTPIRPDNDRDRFWAKVDKSGEHWLWTGATASEGRYGAATLNGCIQPAHRVAWQLEVGPIPDGLDLDHVCRVTLCVRPEPEHLEPVTHKANVLRGTSHQARNAVKTHCKRGHAFTEENTYRLKSGGRSCRTCNRMHARENTRRYRERLRNR